MQLIMSIALSTHLIQLHLRNWSQNSPMQKRVSWMWDSWEGWKAQQGSRKTFSQPPLLAPGLERLIRWHNNWQVWIKRLWEEMRNIYLLLKQRKLHNVKILKKRGSGRSNDVWGEQWVAKRCFDLIQVCNLVEVLGLDPDSWRAHSTGSLPRRRH